VTLQGLYRVEPLSSAHDRSQFFSGSDPLDRYFREHASQDIKRRVATCFVAVNVESHEIAGFYTLAAAGVALVDLAPDISRKLPRYPIVPAALLARLALDRGQQGKGLGGVLPGDAVLRAARADLGVFALLVDAKDDAARRFCEHRGFALLPGDGRRLCLPITTALRRLGK
jgi:GNAT superfamily N-acetyltransferase